MEALRTTILRNLKQNGVELQAVGKVIRIAYYLIPALPLRKVAILAAFRIIRLARIFWLAFFCGRFTMGGTGRTWRFRGNDPVVHWFHIWIEECYRHIQ
jgi:hypothetical protein